MFYSERSVSHLCVCFMNIGLLLLLDTVCKPFTIVVMNITDYEYGLFRLQALKQFHHSDGRHVLVYLPFILARQLRDTVFRHSF
jgi:hypothetical protein